MATAPGRVRRCGVVNRAARQPTQAALVRRSGSGAVNVQAGTRPVYVTGYEEWYRYAGIAELSMVFKEVYRRHPIRISVPCLHCSRAVIFSREHGAATLVSAIVLLEVTLLADEVDFLTVMLAHRTQTASSFACRQAAPAHAFDRSSERMIREAEKLGLWLDKFEAKTAAKVALATAHNRGVARPYGQPLSDHLSRRAEVHEIADLPAHHIDDVLS